LRVVARTSSFQFRGQAQDTRKVGGQLKARTLLVGSVRKSGNKIRSPDLAS
jgi:adenylate cyclase